MSTQGNDGQSAMISTTTDRLLTARKCRLPCFMVARHTKNPDFFERKDAFKQIDDHLLPQKVIQTSGGLEVEQTPRHFAICGMGGIGKTDLAVEYAYARRNVFGAVFWLEAGGTSQLASDFGSIATQLGLEDATEAKDLAASREIAKAWLTKSTVAEGPVDEPQENTSWLLIFDNANNLDIIADYWPRKGNGSILVTSRDPFAKCNFYPSGSGIDLDLLPDEDASRFLRKIIKGSADIDDQDEYEASILMARQLGGLPLAMTQMAGVIRRRQISIREFVTLYAGDAQYAEIHNIDNAAQRDRYGYTLATTYNFNDLTPDATSFLRILSFLNPDRIQEVIFTMQPAEISSRHPFLKSPSSFLNARTDLLSSSIIKRNVEYKELWIHRVIQYEVRAKMTEHERYSTFRDVIAMLSVVWKYGDLDTRRHNISRWKSCEELLPHLERCYQLATENLSVWSSFEADMKLAVLLNEAGV
jgi:NB-ARC domain